MMPPVKKAAPRAVVKLEIIDALFSFASFSLRLCYLKITRDIFFWMVCLFFLTFCFDAFVYCCCGRKMLSGRKIKSSQKKPSTHVHVKREREREKKMSQAAKKLIPLLDRVLVERAVAATKTSGGILLPETVGSKVRFLVSLSVVVDFFFFLLFFFSPLL